MPSFFQGVISAYPEAIFILFGARARRKGNTVSIPAEPHACRDQAWANLALWRIATWNVVVYPTRRNVLPRKHQGFPKKWAV